MTKHNNIFERHPKKTLVSIILLLFLIVDFGGAALLKALGLFEPSYVSSKQLEAYYRKSHPVFHHTLAANIDYDKAEWGRQLYKIRTNSLGFKDRQVRQVALKSEKPRVLFIGDSFTEGVGIEYPHTFVGYIDATLAKRNIEVFNAAVSSYAPIIYFRKVEYLLEEVGLEFDHLIVMPDLSDIEDEALGYTFDDQHNVISRRTIASVGQTTEDQPQPFSLKEFFTQHTILLGRLRNLSAYLRKMKRRWQDSLNQRRARWTLDNGIYEKYGRAGLRLAFEHMSALKQLLDKHQIKMTLAIYPWPDQIYQQEHHNRHTQSWQQWAIQHNAAFLDLYPAFLNRGPAPDVIANLFITGDVHWNAAGHQLVADELLRQLRLPE